MEKRGLVGPANGASAASKPSTALAIGKYALLAEVVLILVLALRRARA